jgi:hypothetical protein
MAKGRVKRFNDQKEFGFKKIYSFIVLQFRVKNLP